jgi:hypothetical protein
MLNTPILFLIFNRPGITRNTFARLREVKPKRLYVAADGARKNKPGEEELCRQTREVIGLVDWDCEVRTLFREDNLGCGKAVSGAITWFFEQEEMGIIIEDDCMPALSFFGYCEKMLNHYRYEERVMHIGGTNFLYGNVPIKESYYFSAQAHVWGWATWRRAWKKYDFNMCAFYSFVRDEKIFNYHRREDMALFWLDIFRKMYYKKIDTWDYQWVFTMYNNNGVSAIPHVNLISNTGFGEGATHTGNSDSVFANNPTGVMEETLVHPAKIELNRTADFFFYQHVEKLPFLQEKRSLTRRGLNFIKRLLGR